MLLEGLRKVAAAHGGAPKGKGEMVGESGSAHSSRAGK